MKNIVCTGFGHRDLFVNINSALYDTVENLITQHGVTEFLTGGMGDFDNAFSGCVRKLKIRYPEIKLHLVKPYFSNELNTNQEYYNSMYDSIIIPDEVSGAHPKSAILKRNRWMTDKSDYIITCIYRDFGGAATAKKYAQNKNKKIIELSKKTDRCDIIMPQTE